MKLVSIITRKTVGLNALTSIASTLVVQSAISLMIVFLSSNTHAFLKTIDIGGGLSHTNLDLDILSGGRKVSASEVDLSPSYSGTGLGFSASFDVYRWISIEMMYNTMGEYIIKSSNPIRKSGNVQFQGVSAYAVYSYPKRNHGWQLHGKFGVFSLVTKTDLNYVKQEDDIGLSAAGGLSYYTREGWGGRLNASLHSANIQVFSLAFSKRFNLITGNVRNVGTENRGRFLATRESDAESDLLGLDENDDFVSDVNLILTEDEQLRRAPSDSDGDGIINADDVCPRTPLGFQVDEDGCALALQEVGDSDQNSIKDKLLYPDEDIVSEEKNLDFESLGSERLERVDLASSEELSRSVGGQIDAINQINDLQDAPPDFEDYFTLSQAQELNRRTDFYDQDEEQLELTEEDYKNIDELSKRSLTLSAVESFSPADNFDFAIRSPDPDSDFLRQNEADLEKERKKDEAFFSDADRRRLDSQLNNRSNDNIAQLRKELQQENPQYVGVLSDEYFVQNDDDVVKLQPLIFDEGEAILNAPQRDYLEGLAYDLRANERSRVQLRVWSADDDQSMQVAQNQLIEVRNFLLENGVNRNQIEQLDEIEVDVVRANQVIIELLE